MLVAFGSDVEPDEDGLPFAVVETAFYRVDANAELQAKLLGFGERFTMDFVRTGKPPPVKPDANRVAWKEKLRANGIDPKDPRFVDIKRKRKAEPDSETVGGDGAGEPHPEDGAQ